MRISTNMIFDAGVSRISAQQAALLKTQQQISANRRILTPSDDPIAAARALDVTQRQSINKQYADNRTQAMNSLNEEEEALKSLTTMIQNLQTQVVEAGNAAYDDDQRGYIATEMRGTLEEIYSLANKRDSVGNYLFSGYKTSTQPYSPNTSGVGADYAGDQGQRRMQVDSVRQIAITDAGETVFNNSTASSTFNFDVKAGSFTKGFMKDATITDASAITGHKYEVDFRVDGTGTDADPYVTSYAIYDIDADPGKTTPLTNNSSKAAAAASPPSPAGYYTYTPTTTNEFTETIEFGGMSFKIGGTRSDGDALTVNTTKESQKQSLFKTVTDLINVLETGTSGSAGNFNLSEGLAAASKNLAESLDNVLTVRASVGARLKEIDSLDSSGEDRDLQYRSILSQLQDLDYIQAASDLSMQKIVLEAAQKSFMNVSGLSLFNYI